MRLDSFNALSMDAAMADLLGCCAARRWAMQVAARRPYAAIDALVETARRAWEGLDRADRLEAYRAHPRPSESVQFRTLQRTVRDALTPLAARATAEALLQRLQAALPAYERRFGHPIFSSQPVLSLDELAGLVEQRLALPAEEERAVTAGDQLVLIERRLRRLLRDDAAPGKSV